MHEAEILELAALGGDNPTIRTADGRMLRRECPCHQYEYGTDEWWSVACETCTDTDGDECQCDGRFWLPVSEDTAFVVCLEWMLSRDGGNEHRRSIRIDQWKRFIGVSMYLPNTGMEGPLHQTLPAAVFAAVRKVSDE